MSSSNILGFPSVSLTDQQIANRLKDQDSRKEKEHQLEVLRAYEAYLDCGLHPVVIKPGTKKPKEHNWLEKGIPAKDQFTGFHNIGVVTGEQSDRLVDIDIDSAELIEAAPHFLPPTRARFGRYYGSSQQKLAHWLYRTNAEKRVNITGPKTKDKRKGGTLIEIRHAGGQTVFPPSYIFDKDLGEPNSGGDFDLVCWDGGRKAALPKPSDFAEVSYDTLKRRVVLLAVTVTCAPYFTSGSFHDTTLAWVGLLCKSGYTQQEAELSVTWLVNQTRQTNLKDRLACVSDTYQRNEDGEVIVGISAFKDLGWPVEIVDWLKNWLRVRSGFESDGRPWVKVIESKETELFDSTLDAMIATKKFYHRGGQICIIQRDHEEAQAKVTDLTESVSMNAWLTREIQFTRSVLDKTTGQFKDQICKAPNSLSAEMANPSTFRGELPVLVGISNTPTITTTGRIIDHHWAYDPELKVFFSCRYAVRKYRPDEALEIVKNVLLDFPFVGGGVRKAKKVDPSLMYVGGKPIKNTSPVDPVSLLDRSGVRRKGEDDTLGHTDVIWGRHLASAMSMLMTAIVRPALDICPAYLVSSSQYKDGKTTLSAIAAAICGTKDVSTSPLARGRDVEEEHEKQISSTLARGKRVIIYDNRDGEQRSEALVEAITSVAPEFRVLGKSEVRTIPNRSMFILNGVNTVLAEDLATRTIKVLLERTEESHKRVFTHPDVVGYAYDNREEIVSALLSLIEWSLSLDDVSGWKAISRFKVWDRLVRRTVMAAVGVDISPPDSEDEDGFMDPREEAKHTVAQWMIELWGRGIRDKKLYGGVYTRASTMADYLVDGSQVEMAIRTLSGKSWMPLSVQLGICCQTLCNITFHHENKKLAMRSKIRDKRQLYQWEEIVTE